MTKNTSGQGFLADGCFDFVQSAWLVTGLLLLAITPAKGEQFGDFGYETNGGFVTITYYTGPGGGVIIPDTINDLPVTSIGEFAFYGSASLTNGSVYFSDPDWTNYPARIYRIRSP